MPEITFNINGAPVTIDAENDDALLYVLRDRLGVRGPKYGCGVGVCGACTSFQDDNAVRPCIVPMAEAAGSTFVTIEGLAVDDVLHPVQQAWIDEDVAQCGYCQAGQIMTAVKLLESEPQPQRRRHRRRDERQCVPVRHVLPDPQGDQTGSGIDVAAATR